MKIEASIAAHEIIVSHGEEELIFPHGVWAKLKSVEANISCFTYTNKFLLKLEVKEQDRMFELYKQIYSLLLIETAREKEKIVTLMIELFKNLDFNDTLRWARISTDIPLQGNYQISPGSKKSHKEETTYNADQTYQLLVYSILLKIAMPIMGTVIRSSKALVGNSYKEITAVSYLHGTTFESMPPWEKLSVFCEAIGVAKAGSIAIPLGTGINREKLPLYLFSMALARRVAPSKLDLIDPHVIISHIRQFSEDNIAYLQTGPYKSKDEDAVRGSTSGSEEPSVSDQLRRTPMITEELVQSASVELERVKNSCLVLGVMPLYPRVKELIAALSASNDYIYHHGLETFEALVMYKHIPGSLIREVSASARVVSVAITAAVLEYHGLFSIRDFMLSKQVPADHNRLSLHHSRKVVWNALTKENELALAVRYGVDPKNIRTSINPCVRMTEALLDFIAQYSWVSPNGEFSSQLRNDIAKCFINIKPLDLMSK